MRLYPLIPAQAGIQMVDAVLAANFAGFPLSRGRAEIN
jgi:hypothetical protein